jgi:hypothetical protein
MYRLSWFVSVHPVRVNGLASVEVLKASDFVPLKATDMPIRCTCGCIEVALCAGLKQYCAGCWTPIRMGIAN